MTQPYAYRASFRDPWERCRTDEARRLQDAGFQIETWEQAAKENAEIVAEEKRGRKLPVISAVFSKFITDDDAAEIVRRRERKKWREGRTRERKQEDAA